MSDGVTLFRDRIAAQRLLVDQWKQPAEPLLFETLRAIDYLFCKELFFPEDCGNDFEGLICSYGVNNVLNRMIPDQLKDDAFRLFPSKISIQDQADNFLLHAGILAMSERLSGWIDEGLVSVRLDVLNKTLPSGIDKVLVLKSHSPGMFKEIVSHRHREWVSDFQVACDVEWERSLQERLTYLRPILERNVATFQDWGMTYATTREIDDYFFECGQIYLRRMWSQDLIGLEELLGGNQFNEYLGLLTALSARAQKHLCYASILKAKKPRLHLRNLLTSYSIYNDLVRELADQLDGDVAHIRDLLRSLTLDPGNKEVHTASDETTWAPVVQVNSNFCILPLYGLEINPFFFLLSDLEKRHSKDWFRAANNREKRWLGELKLFFQPERWQVVNRNVRLKMNGKDLTDIDFMVFDADRNQLGIFQLKWQGPITVDNRARRSAGRNLLEQGNLWIERVLNWLELNCISELGKRAGLKLDGQTKVKLFVIARYNAFFTGFSRQDLRATWADWNHFMKVRVQNLDCSVFELADILLKEAESISNSFGGESYVLPLSDTAVLLNPKSEPKHVQK
jgi:hypothetical protein